MYQCLAFQLNSAASESMFADTQLYNNMVRLVKFIGYNPRGCVPSQFTAKVRADGVDEDTLRQLSLPMFTYVETPLVGKNGNICFATDSAQAFESDTFAGGLDMPFYNGRWRAYGTVYTASGAENEVFVLDGVQSDSAAGRYVPGDFVRVVVGSMYSDSGEAVGEYTYDVTWQNDRNGIFAKSNKDRLDLEAGDNVSTNLYRPQDKVYTVGLNENKTYEVRFGDGVTGRRLRRGDRVYVFYLESDGPEGEIDLADVDFSKLRLKHDWTAMESVVPKELSEQLFGSEDAMRKLFTPSDAGGLNDRLRLSAVSTVPTKFRAEEGVEDIRSNAPGWFKTGNRLITARDTEQYIKAYGDTLGLAGIVDVKCMNNMQYVATLYKWLYENGLKSRNDGRYYLDNVTFNRASFKYIDPADANNTYLWIKTESEMQDEQVVKMQNSINDRLYHLKTITTEYQLVKPVLVKFAICANPDLDDIRDRYLKQTDMYFDQDCESYIEVTLDDNMIYVSSNIQKLVYDQIVRAFDVNSQKLGGIVQFRDIVDSIYAINGVQKVRTVYIRKSDGLSHAYDGVSFASWSDESVLHFHEDLQVGNVMRHVEDFQFPVLEGEDLLFDRIKVITKALHAVHALKY